jgi:hypothetical protein
VHSRESSLASSPGRAEVTTPAGSGTTLRIHASFIGGGSSPRCVGTSCRTSSKDPDAYPIGRATGAVELRSRPHTCSSNDATPIDAVIERRARELLDVLRGSPGWPVRLWATRRTIPRSSIFRVPSGTESWAFLTLFDRPSTGPTTSTDDRRLPRRGGP